jgi:predicted metal-binding membrane protein
MAVYLLGVALASVEMQEPALARAAPIAAGMLVAIAGMTQFTSFKTHHLACCREAPARSLRADAATALRFGLCLGVHCIYCCASFTAVLLVIGVMDLRAMALVTAAITVERLAPEAKRARRAAGAVLGGAGFLMIARELVARFIE